MPELTREEKLKLFEKLPLRLQELMTSEDTGAVLLYLGQKYDLPDEKVHLLSGLVGNIILGIVPIANMVQEIVAKIISDPQVATNLAHDLTDEIFAPAAPPVAKPAIPAMPEVPPEVPPEVSESPRVVDLRKVSPPVPMPQVGTPTPAERDVGEVIDLRNQPRAGPPWAETPPPLTKVPVAAAPIPPRPLTFTKPIELIEADPHRMPKLTPTPQVKAPTSDTYREAVDVLDLRKDKGEF